MEQDALSLFDADRLAVAEHVPVDREKLIADFVTFRRAALIEAFIAASPLSLSALTSLAGEEIHGHVAAAAKGRPKLLQHQENFLIVGARVFLRLNIDRANQAGILAPAQVCAARTCV